MMATLGWAGCMRMDRQTRGRPAGSVAGVTGLEAGVGVQKRQTPPYSGLGALDATSRVSPAATPQWTNRAHGSP